MKNKQDQNEYINPLRWLLPAIVVVIILFVFSAYAFDQKKREVNDIEYITNQMAESVASNVSKEIDYAKSSIELSAVMISQTMTSDTLENPSEVILPMIGSTPFGGIEYIRADGMNVMNIGEPFDASDRVYYKEGIKGNTGIWNNYHPKTSKETLMNFYTPLMYNDEVSGVITGYIEATTQIVPLFEKSLYGQRIYGLLVDEDNMVICSTMDMEYEKDLTLDMFMDNFRVSEGQKQGMQKIINEESGNVVSYRDPSGEGRICVETVPNTTWKVVIIVPTASFNAIISESTTNAVSAISVISIILIIYAAYILLRNGRIRKRIAARNAKLENENLEIHDIVASANMGIWRIELIDGEEPRMYADDTMKKLLGIEGTDAKPEKVYTDWFNNIVPSAVPSVLRSVEKMEQGFFDENTYLWTHQTKGERYVRCGGTSVKIPGGFLLRGYHYDVDDVVREDMAKVDMLRMALNEKNEYNETLNALGDIFYSMHVVDLPSDSCIEFEAENNVKAIVNHTQGAKQMMSNIFKATMTPEYLEKALEFTDLTTVADRMKNKKIISMKLLGNNIGWILASFITMTHDDEGRPIKVIFTTRNIDEEKKHEERLIKKSQTDELTGLLNRRAYEEDIYEHNDVPEEDEFIYISLDVNGLKIINDTKGHTAGDELIVGACYCMKKCLGQYGRLYRTGGDEFVAILFCKVDKLKGILEDFDDTIANWRGNVIDSLSISYGWVSKEEQIGASVRQLGAIAEQRMYENKTAHYKKMGVDRRGQQDAHKALCDLYTKILKINITNDTYQVVNMDTSEQTIEKGFADSISEWLVSFGESGQVHPDDLEEYLKYTSLKYMREYFSGNKTSLHIFYRRKFENEFKQVMMEIIPANDYSKDNQSLFLYVKNIEK